MIWNLYAGQSLSAQTGWMMGILSIITSEVLWRSLTTPSHTTKPNKRALRRLLLISAVLCIIGAGLAIYYHSVGDSLGLRSAIGGIIFVIGICAGTMIKARKLLAKQA